LELLYYVGLESYNVYKSFVLPFEKYQASWQYPCCTYQTQQDRKPSVFFLEFCYLKRQVKNLQTLFCKHLNDALNKVALDQSFSFSNDCEDFHYSKVRLIRKHSRQIYWDLHVFKTNNYYAHGFINHNSGKSHMFAELMLEAHIMDQKRRSVCVREIQKSLNQSVKRLLETKIVDINAGAYFEVQDSVIKSRKGDGAIIFQGMQNHTADSIKSLEGYDCAWVEEAQSLSQSSLDLLRPTIRKPDSELWFTWNPRQQSDPVDFLLRGPEPPANSIVIKVNYSENPWFPDVLKDEMIYDLKRDPDKYQHVWQGEYLRNSNARVFKNWKVDDFEAPAEAIHRLGADWGFAIDPTVLVRCHIIGRTLYIDYEAYMVGCEIVNTPELFMQVPEAEKWPIVADSARPETISHMRKNGFPKIMTAVKGPKSVEEGIEFLKNYDIVVHSRCKHTIDELSLYSYKSDPLTGRILPLLEDKKNHVIDALRYACEGVRRSAVAKPVSFTPLPNVNRW
jgi:phage terminase large subunit